MSIRQVISLDLTRARSGDASAGGALELLDGMMGLLRDLLAAEEEEPRTMLAERVESCRATLASGVALSDLNELIAACLTDGKTVVAAGAEQRRQRLQDSMALVEALREVMTTIGSEMHTMHSSLTQSTERFEAIGQLTNPQQIKARLVAEVLTLKQIAVKRRRAWDETQQRLTKRVETLEADLSIVKSEATTDPLTGIANRRAFSEACERWVKTSRSTFVLAILDVDEFKQVNDTLGHAAGDEVLKNVAGQLAGSFRESDVVARVGGDEFAVLAADLTLRQAERRISDVVAKLYKNEAAPGVPVSVSLSCGIAEFSAGDTAASIYERADHAQYEAKRLGKNRVVANERPLMRDLARR
jgi:diguanylate cyclase